MLNHRSEESRPSRWHSARAAWRRRRRRRSSSIITCKRTWSNDGLVYSASSTPPPTTQTTTRRSPTSSPSSEMTTGWRPLHPSERVLEQQRRRRRRRRRGSQRSRGCTHSARERLMAGRERRPWQQPSALRILVPRSRMRRRMPWGVLCAPPLRRCWRGAVCQVASGEERAGGEEGGGNHHCHPWRRRSRPRLGGLLGRLRRSILAGALLAGLTLR